MKYLLLDGEIVLSATNETAEIAFIKYIHTHHSFSLDWAIKHEGYSIANESDL